MVESDTAQVSVLPMVESDTARVSVLPVTGSKFPAVFFWEGRLGCGRSGRWPAVSPIGFGGNPDRRVSRDELYSSGTNPGRWTFGGDASS